MHQRLVYLSEKNNFSKNSGFHFATLGTFQIHFMPQTYKQISIPQNIFSYFYLNSFHIITLTIITIRKPICKINSKTITTQKHQKKAPKNTQQ